MAYKSETIKQFVDRINNPVIDGGLWLPQIQRPLVWDKEQILLLFDSILRKYPFGTILIWKTDSDMRYRKFIDRYVPKVTKTLDFYMLPNRNIKTLVLDGQQRLQALYLGLKGTYENSNLYFNILSGDGNSTESIYKYEFNFINDKKAQFPWIKFSDLVYTSLSSFKISQHIIKENNIQDESQRERIQENTSLITTCFSSSDEISYSMIDSIDHNDLYKDDDVVEIFIRANNGGTELEKSDLLFTLLVAEWEEAEEKITELIEDLNRTGYKFERDFIIKVCLVLINKGAKYDITKLKDENNITLIKDNWNKISNSIRFVKDFIYEKTFIKTKDTLASDLSLIPLIYLKYHFSESWINSETYADYLIKVNLTGAFGGVNDAFSDGLINIVKSEQKFDREKIYDFIKQKRSLQLSREKILELSYSSKKQTHLLFNIWHGFNYQPSYKGNLPEIDHIFPQSKLKSKYKKKQIDQLANLMLLKSSLNGAGGKSDQLPSEFFSKIIKDEPTFLIDHCIPSDESLWELDNFDAFIQEREKLIVKKFTDIGLISKNE
jgi:uncharacterized protein with ParB-like and HNH nuclease domain